MQRDCNIAISSEMHWLLLEYSKAKFGQLVLPVKGKSGLLKIKQLNENKLEKPNFLWQFVT